MRAVFVFGISTLPWIAIGLFAACSCVTVWAKKNGNEMSTVFKGICWSPVAGFLLIAILEMLDGNKSGGITWLVLGVFNAVLNYANTQKG